MDRTDTKFVTTEDKLVALLLKAKKAYFVQEADGRRIASYYTLYFDTEDSSMFMAHHNGKLNRQKLRIRSYIDSDTSFLEVKTKDNHGRTRKDRTAIHGFDRIHAQDGNIYGVYTETLCDCSDFLAEHFRYKPVDMRAKIENRFSRITLVNKEKTERVTIDTGVVFHSLVTGISLALPRLVIIELKRARRSHSPIFEMLHPLHIKPMGFSKYCVGMTLTDSRLKRNLFLQGIHKINKMTVCN